MDIDSTSIFPEQFLVKQWGYFMSALADHPFFPNWVSSANLSDSGAEALSYTATQVMTPTSRGVFQLKFDAKAMPVPCANKNIARVFLMSACALLAEPSVSVQKVLVFAGGRTLRCHITEMPASLEDDMVASFAKLVGSGVVTKCDDSLFATDEAHAKNMKRRADQVGDSKSVLGFMDRMTTMHGMGGSAKKGGSHAVP